MPALSSHPGTLCGAAARGPPWPCLHCPPVLPAHAVGLLPAPWPSSSCFTVNRAKCVASPPRAAPATAWHGPHGRGCPGGRGAQGVTATAWPVAGDSVSPCPAPPSLQGWQGWGCTQLGGSGCSWGSLRGQLRQGWPRTGCVGSILGGRAGRGGVGGVAAQRGRHAAAWPGEGERDTRDGGERVCGRVGAMQQGGCHAAGRCCGQWRGTHRGMLHPPVQQADRRP